MDTKENVPNKFILEISRRRPNKGNLLIGLSLLRWFHLIIMATKLSPLEKAVKACQKESTHIFYCNKTYGTQPKVCKYNGNRIKVPIQKDGILGYAFRYECKLYNSYKK